MISLPNPFTDSVVIPPAADSAVASSLPVSLGDATADPIYGIGPAITDDLPVIRADNERRRQALIENDNRFVLDEPAFMQAIERPDYLTI